jgi:hypothetical protein
MPARKTCNCTQTPKHTTLQTCQRIKHTIAQTHNIEPPTNQVLDGDSAAMQRHSNFNARVCPPRSYSAVYGRWPVLAYTLCHDSGFCLGTRAEIQIVAGSLGEGARGGPLFTVFSE